MRISSVAIHHETIEPDRRTCGIQQRLRGKRENPEKTLGTGPTNNSKFKAQGNEDSNTNFSGGNRALSLLHQYCASVLTAMRNKKFSSIVLCNLFSLDCIFFSTEQNKNTETLLLEINKLLPGIKDALKKNKTKCKSM